MATIKVRKLDDDVVRQLKRQAAANHRSLEDEVRHILVTALKADVTIRPESFRKLSVRLRRLTAGRVQTPSEILVREDREAEHRGF